MSNDVLTITTALDAPTVEHLVDRITARVLERLEPNSPSPWMNLQTTAAYLDWPAKRLYNLVSANEIPHRKQGGRLLFHRAELDAWLNDFYLGPSEMHP